MWSSEDMRWWQKKLKFINAPQCCHIYISHVIPSWTLHSSLSNKVRISVPTSYQALPTNKFCLPKNNISERKEKKCWSIKDAVRVSNCGPALVSFWFCVTLEGREKKISWDFRWLFIPIWRHKLKKPEISPIKDEWKNKVVYIVKSEGNNSFSWVKIHFDPLLIALRP